MRITHLNLKTVVWSVAVWSVMCTDQVYVVDCDQDWCHAVSKMKTPLFTSLTGWPTTNRSANRSLFKEPKLQRWHPTTFYIDTKDCRELLIVPTYGRLDLIPCLKGHYSWCIQLWFPNNWWGTVSLAKWTIRIQIASVSLFNKLQKSDQGTEYVTRQTDLNNISDNLKSFSNT